MTSESKVLKVLVVDDEPKWQRLIGEHLADVGIVDCEVKTFDNGQSAIEAAEYENFDLCLVDIMLGQDDGFAIVREMAETQSNPYFVLVTGLDDNRELEEKALDCGADTLLYKDFYLARSVRRVCLKAMKRRSA